MRRRYWPCTSRQGRGDAHGLTDLMGLRIAVLDGDAMRDTLAHWLATVPGPFVRLADAGQALTAVQQGQADVALLPRAYADPLLAAGAASRHQGQPAEPDAADLCPGHGDQGTRRCRTDCNGVWTDWKPTAAWRRCACAGSAATATWPSARWPSMACRASANGPGVWAAHPPPRCC